MKQPKQPKPPKTYGTVPLKAVKNAIKKIEDNAKVYNMTAEQIEEMPIEFEFLIGSFFPEVLKNIEKEVNLQYTRGIFDGRRMMKEELENGTQGSSN